MSFVGKVLVVVQVVLSICFMGFAGAVFTAQNNWRNESLKYKDNVASLQKSMDELESEFNNKLTEKTKELNKALSEAETAKAENKALQTSLKNEKAKLATVSS